MVFQTQNTTRLIKPYRVSQGHLSAQRSFFKPGPSRLSKSKTWGSESSGNRTEGASESGYQSGVWKSGNKVGSFMRETQTTCGSRSHAAELMLLVKMKSDHSKLLKHLS